MTVLCQSCADKLRAHYNVTEESDLYLGCCPMHPWTGNTFVRRYELTPQKSRYPRRSGGGGERESGREDDEGREPAD